MLIIVFFFFSQGGNRNQHQDGVDDRLPPVSQRPIQFQYNRSSGQGNLNRERRGAGVSGGNSTRGSRSIGNRRMDDRRRTADDEHTILDNAQDSGDRGKYKT